jgi:hypothetical protein
MGILRPEATTAALSTTIRYSLLAIRRALG